MMTVKGKHSQTGSQGKKLSSTGGGAGGEYSHILMGNIGKD